MSEQVIYDVRVGILQLVVCANGKMKVFCRGQPFRYYSDDPIFVKLIEEIEFLRADRTFLEASVRDLEDRLRKERGN